MYLLGDTGALSTDNILKGAIYNVFYTILPSFLSILTLYTGNSDILNPRGC